VRVLITGAGGQLGRELVRTAPAAATVRALDRTYLDVTDAAAVQAVVGEYQPTVILNAAGYTAVDRAESDQEAAWRLNAVAPRQLAEAARTVQQCRLIHVSTDYVFDGESPRPYQPQDAPNPLSAYGKSKLEGERAVLEVLGNHSVVVRTAWVYSAHGRNFLHTMLRLMRERGVVRVVADQIGSPTATASLAEMLWACAERPGLTGIFHWTDAGVASWYDFAVAIAEEANGRRLLAAPAQVLAIASDDYPTPARRPRCSLLDRRSTIAAVGLEPEHWRVRLRGVLDELTRG
jgi:dTDP-4-dehydrorhamnose reductase